MNPSAPPSGRTAGSGVVISAVVALLTGGLSSLQSRANGELASVLGAAAWASVWSFTSGLVLLTALLALPSTRRGLVRIKDAVAAGQLRWWELLGGVFGAIFVAVQTITVPALGVAMFTVGIVGGQTANALLVDKWGLGPAGRTPITPVRAGAALLTFVGVALAASSRGGAGQVAIVPLLLAVAAGAGVAVQSAVNGRTNQVSGAPLASSWVNFAFGVALLLALAGVELGAGLIQPPRTLVAPWWSLMGGVIGVIYVGVSVVVVARLGVLVMTLLVLTGQLVSAVILDATFPTPGSHVDAQLVAGVAVALVAAGTASLSARPRRT